SESKICSTSYSLSILCFSFKTLGDIKDTKIKKSRLEEGFPYLGAGLEILNRFEKSWFLLHKRTKECAQVAESVDGDIVMLSAHLERGKAALINLQEQLQSLPDFITELDAITANIADVTTSTCSKAAEDKRGEDWSVSP
ncbi:hypothetical protein ATANTOWER_020264, partial [Ataeniobius toweri]|nr:hypothetical protein [Ataeniobius toweri]